MADSDTPPPGATKPPTRRAKTLNQNSRAPQQAT